MKTSVTTAATAATPTAAAVTGAVGSVTGAVTLANGAHGGAAATITLSAPVQADIRKVNNVAIDGAGTVGDPWGPV